MAEKKDYLGDTNFYNISLAEGLAPDPLLTVSEWADKFRVLSQVSSSEPGKWRTSRTPYLKDIMDDLSLSSEVEEVVFVKGSQIGGTECGNNWLGYIVDHAPGPCMMILPRLEDAKKNSKIRIDPMIEASPVLSEKIKEKKSKDSGNTILQKDFPGGFLLLTGANSAAGLKSTPIRFVFGDEIDEYDGDVEGQGDPINLIKARQRTFSKRKSFWCSTPTIEDRSRIDSFYKETDQRRFFVPCPGCDHYQFLIWVQLKWTKGDPDSVYYECEKCKYKIKNWQKTEMMNKGEWRPTVTCKNPKIRGYHASALYSPVGWYSWSDAVAEWEKAQNDKDISKLKTFINTVLGETWKDRGEAPEWKKLYLRRENYKVNSIPNGVCFLTAGVDIQEDRIELEIVGYGRNKESWSIDYRIFYGDTSSIDNDPWIQLQDVVSEVWTAPNGIDLPLKLMAVDSGYRSSIVYSWVRQFPISKVVAIKGSDTLPVIFSQPRAVDIKVKNSKNRSIRRGLKLLTLGVSILKSELYGWLKQDTPLDDERTPYGFCHFPEYDQEHFKRLTSETLETKWIKGRKVYQWVSHGRNEQLDCRIYARAAASIIGMDRFKPEKWDKLEAIVGTITQRENSDIIPKSFKKKKKIIIKRRKSNFMR